MARGPKIVITLTAEEQQTLEMWAGARKGERRLVERAQVVLLSAQGLPLREVSRRSGLSPQNCSKWRKRFSLQRLAGLKDRSRSGRPPSNALVLCVDEKSQIQALDRTQPELPLRAGNARRLTATDKRHGTTCLLAALSVHTGEVSGRCIDKNDHTAFLSFLKSLYRQHPRKELHVILDSLSVHKHHQVQEWVRRRRRLTLHFTPTYASWLNQVEIWFHILSKEVIRGGVWRSKQELVQQIMRYIKEYTQHRAHPFRWTYAGKPLAP